MRNHALFLILASLVLLALPASAQVLTSCPTDDFEDGDFAGWTLDGIGHANQFEAVVIDDAGNSGAGAHVRRRHRLLRRWTTPASSTRS